MILGFVQRLSSLGGTKIGPFDRPRPHLSLLTLRTKPGPLSVRVRQRIREKHHTGSIPAMIEAIGVAEFVDSLCQHPSSKET
jgi:hypothetical protein